jgi:hypothetical protein
MWQNGNFTNILFPDAAGTQPTKINDKGVIVGDYEDTLGSGHGFSFINGTYTPIDRVTPNTLLLGLNNFNNIVGLTENDKGDVFVQRLLCQPILKDVYFHSACLQAGSVS